MDIDFQGLSPATGLLWQSINPAGEVTETLYNTRGQVTETTGTGTYRVTRGYNTYGEMDSMRTYRTTGSAGDLTQWTYDPATGVLKEKTDAAGKKTTYTYYPNGRLFTRTWARPGTVRATYTYNDFGDLTFTNYSDTTPDVTITPDRLGRPETITDASGTRTIAYHPITGATDLVAYGSGGLLPSIQIDYTQDASLRPSGYTVSGGGPSSVLGYDTAGRLSTVTASGDVHTHGYINGTGMLNSLTTTSGGNTVLTRSLHHDRMGRLRGIATANASGTPLSRHGYTLDDAGRRKTATRENGQRWDYGYDTLGQVTSAVKKFPDAAAIPGHTFGYAYDGIGNRTSATHGGTGTAVTYTPNALNQYTNISTGGGRFILGEAPAANEVTVNNLTTSRAGGLGFFWKQLSASNASGPVWSNDSVVSNGVTVTGRTWTPAASVAPSYDEDGNLNSDGRWDYLWDAENRLIQMKSTAAALAAATASGIPAQKLDFVYDSQGRRISKTVSTSTNGTTWTFLSNQRFLYDDWNLIAEYSAPSATSTTLTLQATHTWGIDLSGTTQDAGGVGGLLCTTLSSQPSPLNCHPAYDGNGNISAWIDATGTLLARMDYSPFGQLIAQYNFTSAGSTTLSRLSFGFSTKYTDAESGLLYYGFRYYDPVTGRWPSRDPIGENGGVNLHGFLGNNGVGRNDYVGLWDSRIHKDATSKWAIEIGITPDTADRIGGHDDAVDTKYNPIKPSNWSWHFDRDSSMSDSRRTHFERLFKLAKESCDFVGKGNDKPVAAAWALGEGLHPLQDIYAHSDYNRSNEVNPSLMVLGGLSSYWHNFIAPYRGSQYDPDDPDKDANTLSGYATFYERHYTAYPGFSSNIVIGHNYRQGHARIKKTEEETKSAYIEIRKFIEGNGGEEHPNCECRKAFGVPL